jgi:hypothetical protein
MPEGLGTIILFVGVVTMMVTIYLLRREKGGSQELLVQLTRTSIALVATFCIFYSMVHERAIPDGLLALYGVIIALYFKSDTVLRDPDKEAPTSKEAPDEPSKEAPDEPNDQPR